MLPVPLLRHAHPPGTPRSDTRRLRPCVRIASNNQETSATTRIEKGRNQRAVNRAMDWIRRALMQSQLAPRPTVADGAIKPNQEQCNEVEAKLRDPFAIHTVQNMIWCAAARSTVCWVRPYVATNSTDQASTGQRRNHQSRFPKIRTKTHHPLYPDPSIHSALEIQKMANMPKGHILTAKPLHSALKTHQCGH